MSKRKREERIKLLQEIESVAHEIQEKVGDRVSRLQSSDTSVELQPYLRKETGKSIAWTGPTIDEVEEFSRRLEERLKKRFQEHRFEVKTIDLNRSVGTVFCTTVRIL